jgi:hypothetical protein
MDKQFLREIYNDVRTPKNRKKVNEDGFYEASEKDWEEFWEDVSKDPQDLFE